MHDTAGDWNNRLVGVDGVINAAGALRGDLHRLQHTGPAALFNACAHTRVPHVLQISALGAGEQIARPFLATKHAADRHLLRLAAELGMRGWSVVRPSVVIGRGGASTELFSALAATPFPVRLGPGTWRVQPIHVADLSELVANLIEQDRPPSLLDAVGPVALTTDELTLMLRAWLGVPRRPFITLPTPMLRMAAWIGDGLPGVSLNNETLAMLSRGNTAEVAPIWRRFGSPPRHLADAMAGEPATRADLWLARLWPLRTVMHCALVAVWVGSAAASFLLPPDLASTLLGWLTSDLTTAIAVTWSGAVLDAVLGLSLLVPGWRRRALQAQVVLMLVYTIVATVVLPALWVDPFGPLLKNFAVLAVTLALLAVED